MQNALSLLGLLAVLGVPSICLFLVMKANKRAEIAEEKSRQLQFEGLLNETKKQIDSANPDDIAAIANSMYPKGSGKPDT